MRADPAHRPLAGLALRAQPDERLVDLFRQGHERAYDEIVHRYRSALVAFAGAIVPPHRAEDVVQESLLRAHGALGGENEMEVRPWLYTIVRNRALNSLRDEHVHEHLAEDYDGVPQPPDVLARREELTGLVAQLKALPDAQREALVRRELEGRSHEEIAIALGATPGAVRGLIFRARSGLRAVSGILVPPSLAEWTLGPGGSSVAGIAAGGGASVLMKAGVAATVGALAVGGGVVLHNRSPSRPTARVEAAVSPHAERGGDSSPQSDTSRITSPPASQGPSSGSSADSHAGSAGHDGSTSSSGSSGSGPVGISSSGSSTLSAGSGTPGSGTSGSGSTHSGDTSGGSGGGGTPSGSGDGGGSGSGGQHSGSGGSSGDTSGSGGSGGGSRDTSGSDGGSSDGGSGGTSGDGSGDGGSGGSGDGSGDGSGSGDGGGLLIPPPGTD